MFDLNHATYEVIGEKCHRYSSTEISGGEETHSYAPPYFISRHVEPIRSTTTHHSHQEIWARNTETGDEKRFDFKRFNIEVRPGHKILVVWDSADGTIHRIVNLDTDTQWAGDSIYYTWGKNPSLRFCSKFRAIWAAVVTGILALIPVLGWAVIASFGYVAMIMGSFRFSPFTRTNRLYGVFLIVMVVVLVDLSLTSGPGSSSWLGAHGSILPFWMFVHFFSYVLWPADYFAFGIMQLDSTPEIRWVVRTIWYGVIIAMVTFWVWRKNGRKLRHGVEEIEVYTKRALGRN